MRGEVADMTLVKQFGGRSLGRSDFQTFRRSDGQKNWW